MNLIRLEKAKTIIVEVTSDSIILNNEQDAVRLMEETFATGATKIVLHKENITPEFFDLKTGVAGAILQKFVNYHLRVAILGDFSKVSSSSLKAFIFESNRGKQIFFLENLESAIQKFDSLA